MVQDQLFVLDRLLLLPVVGLGDFVEGCTLHTSRRTGKCVRTLPQARFGTKRAMITPSS